MSLDTMKIYHDLIASGMSDIQAKAQVNAISEAEKRLEAKATNIYGEICLYITKMKEQFVSHKMISLYAYVIFLSLALVGGELYYIAHSHAAIKSDVKHIKEKLHDRK